MARGERKGGCRLSKAARWLDLIAFLLQHRFPVTREAIFEHVTEYREDLEQGTDRESVRRKFERDKDELRKMGISIETIEIPDAASDEPQQGYRLRPADFYLPYVGVGRSQTVGRSDSLTVGRERHAQGETRPYPGLPTIIVSQSDLAILDRATRRLAERTEFPLAHAAASARRKLAFDLPLSLGSVERVLASPRARESKDALAVLQDAVLRRLVVRCTYYSIGRDAEEQRELYPYGLFFNWGHWYCVAGGREYKGWKVFRVDRMTAAASMKDKEPAFELPPKFRVREFLGRPPWRLTEGDGLRVRVRFAFPESRWVLGRGLGTPIVPLTKDGGAEIEFEVADKNPFLRWLLTFRHHAEILRPESLQEELTRLSKRVAALYRRD